nr:hypothetical protein [uncultured Bacteroides sp.]
MNVLIPFVILILGLVWNWHANKLQKIEETKNFRYVIFSWILSAHSSLEKQYNGLYKLSKAIRLSEDINPERFEYLALSYNKLSSISLEIYIYIFVINSIDNNKNIEKQKDNVYKLINSLEYLTQIPSHIKEKYEDYCKSYRNIIERCNDCYLKLISLIKDVDSHRAEYESDEIELCNFIINAVKNYISECEKRVSSGKVKTLIFKTLVRPIEKEIPDRPSLYFNEVKDVIMRYNALKRQWDIDQEGFSQIFKEYAGAMKNVDDKMETIKYYLEKETKVKNIFHI